MIESLAVRKEYGQTVAVKDLSFSIPARSIVALVGPNGAGKSTWLKMAAGLLEPTNGTIKVDGVDVRENPKEVHKRLGFLPDFFGLYSDLRCDEYLMYFAYAYGLADEDAKVRVDQVLHQVKLSEKRLANVGSLSRGMAQRLAIARSLINKPLVLILDEPAAGLDPEARYELQELFKRLSAEGHTLIVSSHILSELESYCTHVVMIEKGEVLASGPIVEVQRVLSGQRRIRLVPLERAQELADFLTEKGFTHTSASSEITFGFSGSDQELSNLLKEIFERGFSLVSFAPEESKIQDAYIRLLKESRS